jgi:hypothetical protein
MRPNKEGTTKYSGSAKANSSFSILEGLTEQCRRVANTLLGWVGFGLGEREMACGYYRQFTGNNMANPLYSDSRSVFVRTGFRLSIPGRPSTEAFDWIFR